MQNNVTEDYLNALENEITAFKDKVSSGNCSSFEEYKSHVGYIRGIEVSRSLLQETLKKSLSTVSIDEDESEMKFNEDLSDIDNAEQMLDNDEELDMDLMRQIYPGMAD